MYGLKYFCITWIILNIKNFNIFDRSMAPKQLLELWIIGACSNGNEQWVHSPPKIQIWSNTTKYSLMFYAGHSFFFLVWS